MAAPRKTLSISDEVLLHLDGSVRTDALSILHAALEEWKGVLVFTRRPGVAKKQIALAESALRNAGLYSGVRVIVRRLTFSMTRPEGSPLLATHAISWKGRVPSIADAN